MVDSEKFTSERQLNKRLTNEIAIFWQQGVFSNFSGINNIRINYAYFLQKETLPNLILIPGRCESYLKYKELCFDLYRQGYNIFIIDHRGQGLSERLLENPNKGYVDDFQNYVDDLKIFINGVVNKFSTTKPYFLAHSMGGAIATRYLQSYPGTIQAAVLLSPMMGFNSGTIPENVAEILVKKAEQMNQWLSDKPWYFLGQQNFIPTLFTDNKLSHSPARYQEYIDLYLSVPEIQLGGVTVKWLVEGIKAQEEIFVNLDKITCPVQVIQASDDIIIKNQAQNDFCLKLHQRMPLSCPNGKPVVIEGAYHELLFEVDEYRNQALEVSLSWLEQHK